MMSSESTFSARLVVIEGNDKGKTFPLNPGSIVVGRVKSDIIISDPRISREHVRLEFDPQNQKLFFNDLKSLNGCQINGTTLPAGELKDGDKIQIGNTILDCQMGFAVELTFNTRKEPVLKTEKFENPSEEAPNSEKEPTPTVIKKPPTAVSKTKKSIQLAVISMILLFVALTLLRSKSEPNGVNPSLDTQKELSAIQKAIEQEQLLQALNMAVELQKKFPNYPELEEILGDLYVKQKKLEPAIQNYKASIEHQNISKAIHFKLTRAYLTAGFQALATEHLKIIDKLIKESPKERELFIELASLLLEHPELNSSFERGIIISKALQNEIATDSTLGYRLEGLVLSQAKKLKEAEAVYEKALMISPNDQEVLEQLTATKLNLQDIKGAKVIIDKWLAQNPNEVRALLAFSYINFYEKDYLAAVPKLMSVIHLLSKTPEAPRRLEALHLLGLVYWEQGQRTEAESYLSQSCKLGFQASCNHQALLTQESSSPTKVQSPNPP
ncbi:MAG: FHA domain-containing protein [Pseudomonadota bacterium]